MPVFALPIAQSATIQHSQNLATGSSRVHFSSLSTRKRKRPPADDPSSSEDENIISSSEDELLAASTNPLSLTPAEIIQYKIAGLEIDEPLPSESIKDFPHRALPAQGLPSRLKKGKGKRKKYISNNLVEESDSDAEKSKSRAKRPERGPGLRLQHLSVLTTILQRCLLEGDIQRASRAWAILIRMQVSGQAIDLRGSGYWGIGAELLVRSLEKKKKFQSEKDVDSDSNEEGEGENTRRWGSKEGLERAKDYYERLILQHPYKRQFDTSISALDFWPAMVACEIYGIQFEHTQGLAKLSKEEDDDEGEARSDSESESVEELELEEDEDEDSSFAASQRRKDLRLARRAERRWLLREDVRQTALTASEKLAARLDELMSTPPYSDNHNLLRIRGMLALYIGDLSVPARPDEEVGANEDSGKRFTYRQRMSAYEKGVKIQRQEHERARGLFVRIKKGRGYLEGIRDMALDEELHEGDEVS